MCTPGFRGVFLTQVCFIYVCLFFFALEWLFVKFVGSFFDAEVSLSDIDVFLSVPLLEVSLV